MSDWTDENVIDDVTLRLVASENGILEILLRWSEPPAGRPNPDNPILVETARQ